MTFESWSFCGQRWPRQHYVFALWAILFVAFGRLALLPALADGCFVFRWNKEIDIKEPSQKAIIVYDAGREDLLLQVKYEGPLEQFGWLIPVPSLPTVEKGSMQPFYELSQLTQRQHGGVLTLSALAPGGYGGRGEPVKVIQVKTVGAYEIAVLSTKETGSLERWLKDHDYSIPQGHRQIIDEYIRNGWYFIAAKIELDKEVGFQPAPATSPKNTDVSAGSYSFIQKQLGSGELHPLLISFDTTRCIYPLRISALAGKSSEVSLYVLSAQPLLNEFIFDKSAAQAQRRRHELGQTLKNRGSSVEWSAQELQILRYASMMRALIPPGEKANTTARDWSDRDLDALAAESWPHTGPELLDLRSLVRSYEVIECKEVKTQQIPQCAKELPRLKGRSWSLVKQVCTFMPEDMHDLLLDPPIPFLATELAQPAGAEVAAVLTHLGAAADPVLLKACTSTNALERINGSAALHAERDPRAAGLLLTLFQDEEPQVRYNALLAANTTPDPRFLERMVTLLHDAHSEIRWQAVLWLGANETKKRAAVYVALLQDPDPDVQLCALQVLSRIDPDAISRASLLHMLGTPNLETVGLALDLLQGGWPSGWPSRSRIALRRSIGADESDSLSSVEAAPLITNRLTMARVTGLKILRENADAEAVALTLPLLRDANSLVRNRAFAVLHAVSGQDIPESDPAKWDQWWAANKWTFVPAKPAPY